MIFSKQVKNSSTHTEKQFPKRNCFSFLYLQKKPNVVTACRKVTFYVNIAYDTVNIGNIAELIGGKCVDFAAVAKKNPFFGIFYHKPPRYDFIRKAII